MAAAPATPAEAYRHLGALVAQDGWERFVTRHGLDLLVVFGSVVAANPSGAPADLDVAVRFRDGADGDVFALTTDLIALLHLDAVDVLDLRRAGVVARAEALGRGIPLYERTAGAFAREQMAALGLRMESGWLTDLSLHLVDLAAAINAHLAAAALDEVPRDLTESFYLVARAGAIPDDLATRLRPSAGMRNVIVRGDQDLDLQRVAAAVPRANRRLR